MKALILSLTLALVALPVTAQEAIPDPSSSPAPNEAAETTQILDRFYFGLGLPLMFSYNTYPALDPNTNEGRTSEVPNGAWANGLGLTVGFEKMLDTRFSLLLEMALMTMDLNQLLVHSWDTPPRKTGATLFNASFGVKAHLVPDRPVRPYFTAGAGISAMRLGQMQVIPTSVVVPEYIGVRFLARVGAGLDIRCDDEMTAFFEFQFDDMDTFNLLSIGPDASASLFKSGLRLAM